MKPVFPYPTLFGDISLEVLSVTVDGAALPYANVSKVERTVALHQTGRKWWEQATLQLKATLPEPELTDGTWSDVACLAVLTEKATNARTAVPLTRGSAGMWQGSIDLYRAMHLNRAVLGVIVVGTVDGVTGRVIGTLDQEWYVDLNATSPVRRREIEIVEADFREGPFEWLRPFKESPWIIETADDVPTVYLNTTAVEGLMEVLSSTGGSAAEQVLRHMTASQLAQDAWTAMFHTAISELDFDEDDTPVLPSGWRESVLRTMLPDILPGRQLTDALYEINDRRVRGSGWSQLQTGIQYAAGKRSQVTKKLTNAVRSVDQTARSTAR